MNKSTVLASLVRAVALVACAAVVAAANPVTAALAQPAASAPPGTTWVIFVDDLHLEFRDTGRIRTLLQTVVRELRQAGDTFGIVSTGPSSLAIDLTSDRQRIEAAIKKVTGNALRPSDLHMAGKPFVEEPELRYRATIALETAYDVMKNLDYIRDRRKAFIYVSNGYPFEASPPVGASMSAAELFARPRRAFSVAGVGLQISVAEARDKLAALPRVAASAGVTIFAIDPRGLDPAALRDPNMPAAQSYMTMTRESLRALSEQTGGFALLDLPDPAAALKRISSAIR